MCRCIAVAWYLVSALHLLLMLHMYLLLLPHVLNLFLMQFHLSFLRGWWAFAHMS